MIKVANGDLVKSFDLPKATLLAFSPLNKVLVTWKQYTSEYTEGMYWEHWFITSKHSKYQSIEVMILCIVQGYIQSLAKNMESLLLEDVHLADLRQNHGLVKPNKP